MSLLVVLAVATLPTTSQADSQPSSVKDCGSIQALGKRLAVDIARGRFPLSCESARRVIRRYLGRGGRRYDILAYEGMVFHCYRSRPDGLGWDYHCTHATRVRYVDIGAGRR